MKKHKIKHKDLHAIKEVIDAAIAGGGDAVLELDDDTTVPPVQPSTGPPPFEHNPNG